MLSRIRIAKSLLSSRLITSQRPFSIDAEEVSLKEDEVRGIPFIKKITTDLEKVKDIKYILPFHDDNLMKKITKSFDYYTNIGVKPEFLYDACLHEPTLLKAMVKEGEKIIKITNILVEVTEMTYENAIRLLTTYMDDFLSTTVEDIQARLQVFIDTGITDSSALCKIVCKCPAILLSGNPEEMSKLTRLMYNFFTRNQIKTILQNSPQCVVKKFEELEEKYEYIYFLMGIENEEFKYCKNWVDMPLDDIIKRHEFLLKCGRYVTPDPKRLQLQKENPPLYRIIDTDSVIFATQVASVTTEEWIVYEGLHEKLKELEKKDRPFERVKPSILFLILSILLCAMIPRKYASLNSPIMAINVITSCLSTVPSDCSSVFSVIDNDWKVKGELITETEISQLSTISEDKYYKKEIELEYQDCSDDPSILFNNNIIKSHISTIIDTKKLKSALPLHILYAFPVTRARVYKSFPKNLFHEIRYAKEQGIWSQPNTNKIHSVILMVSTINGMEEKNFPLPIDGDSNNISKEDRCSERSYQIIINEELINSARLENDIETFEVEETICSRKEILCEEIVDEGIVDDNKRYTMKLRLEKEENSTRGEGASFDKERIVSRNFKGSMNIRDRLAEYKNSFIDYSNKCIKKCRNIAPHPLNAYFPEKNIQFKEFVEYDKLPKKVIKKEPINIRTKIYPIKKEHQGSTKYSTIVDTVNENEALEEGEINFSMIGTEIDETESSTNCSTTIQEVNCEELNQKLNNINIENEYTDDSSKLISLPNTFSFLSKDFTTSCDARRVVKRNYTDTWTSTTIESDDETIIYEDMLQQLNSIKNVLNNFDIHYHTTQKKEACKQKKKTIIMRGPDEVPVTHLIVDAAGFLKKAKLIDIGSKLYTTSSVVGEIKDKATKEYIQSIPYDIEIKEPSKESLVKVIEVAKKTGDYPSLSGPDLGIIALTLDIHIQSVGEDNINYDVKSKVQEKKIEKKNVIGDSFVGFVNPKKSSSTIKKDDDDSFGEEEKEVEGNENVTEKVEEEGEDNTSSKEEEEEEDDDDEVLEDDSETSDDEGWITSSNFTEAVTKLDSLGITNEHQEVACLSTDFAVQNVLKHMNLGIVSVDGYQIKVLKSYILRCRACFATTSVMTKKFCPKCGHHSLHRVGVTVNDDGEMILHINYEKLHCKRGMKYSLPTFKGGKHSKDPIIFEDQRVPHNRMATLHDSKQLDSPFSLNDVTSRSAMLGLRSYEKHLSGNRNQHGRGRKRGGKKR